MILYTLSLIFVVYIYQYIIFILFYSKFFNYILITFTFLKHIYKIMFLLKLKDDSFASITNLKMKYFILYTYYIVVEHMK